MCQYFNQEVTHVFSTLGWEQEYFLVDERFYNARPDLLMTGRTIFGAKPAKGQELDDHYFGSIPERVQNFMKEFELQALRLGIPIVTRHNEVAPGQYECAPKFEESNVANDHNLLIMELMEKLVIKYKFRILFNEKPFAGLNGSGKHSNWSLATGDRRNLLSPGDNPGGNLEFLTFFINVLKAVNDNESLIRASIASAGNDHRLGANEAPPAIISISIGSMMEKVLEVFKTDGLSSRSAEENEPIDLNLTKILKVEKGSTDRNRTSPFPFNDNRFEFRAVGSSANCAGPITILNAVVANQLRSFKEQIDALDSDNAKTEENIVSVLQGYMEDATRIIFNGDGYSEEWEKEAESRGLSNNKNTPAALKPLVSDQSKQLFKVQNIFSEEELEARYEVSLENYISKISIEADLFREMSYTYVLPSTYEHINKLGETFRNLNDMGLGDQANGIVKQVALLSYLAEKIDQDVQEMIKAKAKADQESSTSKCAQAYADKVKPLFDKIRSAMDKLEGQIDDNFWKLPKYRELLFLK